MAAPTRCRPRRAFTLVELLVVIGITKVMVARPGCPRGPIAAELNVCGNPFPPTTS